MIRMLHWRGAPAMSGRLHACTPHPSAPRLARNSASVAPCALARAPCARPASSRPPAAIPIALRAHLRVLMWIHLQIDGTPQFSRRRRTYALCQHSPQQLHLRMSRSAHLRTFGGANRAGPRPREPPQRAQAVHPRPVGSFQPEFGMRKIFPRQTEPFFGLDHSRFGTRLGISPERLRIPRPQQPGAAGNDQAQFRKFSFFKKKFFVPPA